MSDETTAYTTRNNIMKLLSDDEVAKVSTAETHHLKDGDEYVDLEHPAKGVLHAGKAATTPMGHVLPKSAVHADTWTKIVKELGTAGHHHH